MALLIKKGYGNKTFNRGFTLVEVLIALFLLLIISSALLILFANSYRNIEMSGQKNKELYRIQENLEQSISSNTAPEEKDLIISFPGVEQSVRMPGKIHKEKAKIQGEEISISIFIPKQ